MEDFWLSKKVFVTGAGGFIGSHLVEKLIECKAEVTALVHYNSRNDWGLLEFISNKDAENLKIVKGDLQDAFMMKKLLHGQEYVFHLGALIGIPYSYEAPNAYISTNIQGTANLFQGCLKAGVTKVIHTSTSEVYGTAIYTPIDENHPLQGQSPYSASKIAADMLAQSYAYSFQLPAVILRPFNTYGPRQSARAVIPTIISQILIRNSIEIGLLTPYRDFNYVEDVINGFLYIALSPFKDAEIFNLASGKQISVWELAKKVQKILGTDLPINESKSRHRPSKSEVMSLIGDASKLREKTPWRPLIDFEEGLKRTIEFIKEHIDLYKTQEYVR